MLVYIKFDTIQGVSWFTCTRKIILPDNKEEKSVGEEGHFKKKIISAIVFGWPWPMGQLQYNHNLLKDDDNETDTIIIS